MFEDLEFFQGFADTWRDVLDPDVHLGSARSTLKRLCYSVFPTYGSDDEMDDGYFDPTSAELDGFQRGLSMRGFAALERLEMEQLLVYGPVFAEPDDVPRTNKSTVDRQLPHAGQPKRPRHTCDESSILVVPFRRGSIAPAVDGLETLEVWRGRRW